MAELINLNPISKPLDYPDMMKIQLRAKTTLKNIQDMNMQLMQVVSKMQSIGEEIQKKDNLPDPSTLSRDELAKIIDQYKSQTTKIINDTRIRDLNEKAKSIDDDIQKLIVDYCVYGFNGILPNVKILASNIIGIVSSCFHMREDRMRMMGIQLPDLLDDYEMIFQEVSAIITNMAQAHGWNEYAAQIPVKQEMYDAIFFNKDTRTLYQNWPIPVNGSQYLFGYDHVKKTITFIKADSLDSDEAIYPIDKVKNGNLFVVQAPNDEKTFYISLIPTK